MWSLSRQARVMPNIKEVTISLRQGQRVRERIFLSADIIISCVLSGFLFVIVVVDDEMEAMSRSYICVQDVTKTIAICLCRSRTRCRSEILTSLIIHIITTDQPGVLYGGMASHALLNVTIHARNRRKPVDITSDCIILI